MRRHAALRDARRAALSSTTERGKSGPTAAIAMAFPSPQSTRDLPLVSCANSGAMKLIMANRIMFIDTPAVPPGRRTHGEPEWEGIPPNMWVSVMLQCLPAVGPPLPLNFTGPRHVPPAAHD